MGSPQNTAGRGDLKEDGGILFPPSPGLRHACKQACSARDLHGYWWALPNTPSLLSTLLDLAFLLPEDNPVAIEVCGTESKDTLIRDTVPAPGNCL